MPYSDYGYAICVEFQSTENFTPCPEKMSLAHLGGVAKIIVTDNLKTSVVKTDRYESDINPACEDVDNNYRFVSILCQLGKPFLKFLVENHVRLVYHRVCVNMAPFLNLGTQQGAYRVDNRPQSDPNAENIQTSARLTSMRMRNRFCSLSMKWNAR